MILIVGHRDDPHVAAVARHLKARSCLFSVLDSAEATFGGITHATSQSLSIQVGTEKQVPLSDCSAVWWRQKPGFTIPGDAMALYDYYFVHREWNQVVDYLASETSCCFSINDRVQ